MTRRYRVLLPLLVHTEDGAYGQHEEFEKDFTEEDELTNVQSGLLEVVPIRYRVVGDSEVYGVRKDDDDPTFEKALLIGEERHLLAGGHVELADDKAAKPARKKKPKT